MREVQASEAKTHFLKLLDDVENGETLVITRHGKPVARIVPDEENWRQRAQEAVEGMRALRKQIGAKMTYEEIKAAVNEGRP